MTSSCPLLRRTWPSWLLAGALVASVLVCSDEAEAAPGDWRKADTTSAKKLVQAGDERLAAKDYPGALDAYQKAHAIMGVPTTAVPVARLQLLLGKLVEAKAACQFAIDFELAPDDPQEFGQARGEAFELMKEAEGRIPYLRIVVMGIDEGVAVDVKIDGEVLGGGEAERMHGVNPGTYVVSAHAEGYAEAKETVTLKEKQQRTVELFLEGTGAAGTNGPEPETPKAPPPAPDSVGESDYTLAIVGFSIAGVGAIAGGITGGLAFAAAGDAKDQCENDVCPPSAQSDIDSGTTLAHISTVSFAVAGLGLGLGVIGLAIAPAAETPTSRGGAPSPSARVTFQPLLAGGAVGVDGRF